MSRSKRAISLGSGAVILGALSGIAQAQGAPQEQQPVQQPIQRQTVQQQAVTPQAQKARPFPQELAGVSDQDLTSIAANWQQLSPLQRRALLVETTRRMDSKKRASSTPRSGRLSIRVQRRYGRSQNGSVVISTRRVLQVRPGVQPQDPSQQMPVQQTPRNDPSSNAKARLVDGRPMARASFGEGFESRRAQEVGVEKVQDESKPAP